MEASGNSGELACTEGQWARMLSWMLNGIEEITIWILLFACFVCEG